MAFWRRIWQRGQDGALAACTALDVGTEFAEQSPLPEGRETLVGVFATDDEVQP